MLKKIKMDDITAFDLLGILVSSSIKILRGNWMKLFLNSSHGLLFVGKNSTVLNKRKISIGKNVKFESNCEIQGLSKKGILIGNNVTIGRNAMIRPSSYYGVEIGEGMSIGNNSSIGPLCYVGCAGYIEIGENVMIGPRVSLFAENHNFGSTEETIKEQGVVRKGIVIEDDCWIGSGVIILDGVTIGRGTVIAAGSVVSKSIPSKSIVIDKKNKVIKSR